MRFGLVRSSPRAPAQVDNVRLRSEAYVDEFKGKTIRDLGDWEGQSCADSKEELTGRRRRLR
jgi:hypothetical protein